MPSLSLSSQVRDVDIHLVLICCDTVCENLRSCSDGWILDAIAAAEHFLSRGDCSAFSTMRESWTHRRDDDGIMVCWLRELPQGCVVIDESSTSFFSSTASPPKIWRQRRYRVRCDVGRLYCTLFWCTYLCNWRRGVFRTFQASSNF